MAAFARGIDETSNAVQLNDFFGKTFYFFKFVFSKCNFTCVFICFFICQSTFFNLTIFQPWIFSVQGFSLNFARILGRAVDKLLPNGSRAGAGAPVKG